MNTRPLHLTVSLTGPCHCPSTPLSPGAYAAGLREMARTAERGKLDAIWLGLPAATETMRLDPLPLLGSMIAVTERIGLGAAWTIDFTEPYNVARVFATLDHLSYGRTAWLAQMFGTEALLPRIGREPPTRDEPAYCQRAGEFVAVVGKLWDSWQDEAFALDTASGMFVDPDRVHPIHHSGEYFTVRGPLNVPRPPQGNPVIAMIDPTSAIARQFVAATADVILTAEASLPQSRARYRELHELAAVSGRAPDALRILADINIVLGHTESAAQRRAAELDAVTPSEAALASMRFVGTAEQLVDLFALWQAERACDGFNIKPAVLPDDLNYVVDAAIPLALHRGLVRRDYDDTTLREHLGLARPRSHYEQAAP